MQQLSFFSQSQAKVVSPHISKQDQTMIAEVKSKWSEPPLNEAISGVYVFFDNYYAKFGENHPSVSQCTIYRCIDKAFQFGIDASQLHNLLDWILNTDFNAKTLVNATSNTVMEWFKDENVF